MAVEVVGVDSQPSEWKRMIQAGRKHRRKGSSMMRMIVRWKRKMTAQRRPKRRDVEMSRISIRSLSLHGHSNPKAFHRVSQLTTGW